ncbi:unnamed protein product, partial [Rotaria sordida]
MYRCFYLIIRLSEIIIFILGWRSCIHKGSALGTPYFTAYRALVI